MAVVTLSVPEETLQKYGKKRGEKQLLQERLVEQLIRFEDVGKEDRMVVVRNPARIEIEKVMGHELTSDEDLVKFVKRIGGLQFEGVEIQLTASQRSRIGESAKFFGKTPGEYVKVTLERAIANSIGA